MQVWERSIKSFFFFHQTSENCLNALLWLVVDKSLKAVSLRIGSPDGLHTNTRQSILHHFPGLPLRWTQPLHIISMSFGRLDCTVSQRWVEGSVCIRLQINIYVATSSISDCGIIGFPFWTEPLLQHWGNVQFSGVCPPFLVLQTRIVPYILQNETLQMISCNTVNILANINVDRCQTDLF